MKNSPLLNRRDFLMNSGVAAIAGLPLGDRFVHTTGHSPQTPEGPDSGAGPLAGSEYLFGKGVTYLNTAALGPTPRAVFDKTVAAWYDLEANPSFHGYGRLKDAMESVRAKAAQFLGCSLDEMVVTRSTTEGMNTVAQGVVLKPGERVLTSDQEHLGGQMCWKHFARRHGVVIDTVALHPMEHDPQLILERFEAALTPSTRVLSVSHVLSSTGLRMPVGELAALARNHDCLCLVDGAQAVGAIDVNVKALGCHAYATSGHKWLMGPKGTGLLYLAAETTGVIDPLLLEDGRGVYVESTGVRYIPGVLGLGAALDLMTGIGMASVEAHAVGLRNGLYQELQELPQLEVVSPPPGPLATPLITFRLPEAIDSAVLVATLREKHGLVVKMVPKNWLNGIRISTHIFNSEQEIHRLIRALRAELA
ncbi:MAG TPA: aminotransferase class V-fold PLP-dependent enzyme [Gemmatimonadales bacterium]|nr:aminotransferase class V-fold PLP-dependent enzyme [Gemmatimonadales bacterium]